jgi:hypothetical protein
MEDGNIKANPMKAYDLVIQDDLKELIELVNEAVNVGYLPVGGTLFDGTQYIQAIFIPLPIPQIPKKSGS